MTLSLLLLALLSGAPTPPARKPDARRALWVLQPGRHPGGTQCSNCHVPSSWSEVKFDHVRTGYALEGRHAQAACKSCHVVDLATPLPRACAACHADVHAGELGARCEGCHVPTDWRSRMDVEAHRRTNFPLLGAHAGLPCTECHAEARERRFSRAAVDCAACHEKDALRTVGRAVDHVALGFSGRSCRECHGAVRFSPALYPAHDDCFPISAGDHAGIRCDGCHASLGAATGAALRQCRTGTATLCVRCHTNAGGDDTGATDAQHRGVPGYAYVPQKCAQCHAGPGGAP